jgi:hypothetical protein
MTKDGILEVESEARAKLAICEFSNNNYHCLITIGWGILTIALRLLPMLLKDILHRILPSINDQ